MRTLAALLLGVLCLSNLASAQSTAEGGRATSSAGGAAAPAPAVSETGRQDLLGPWQALRPVADDPGQSELKVAESAGADQWLAVRAPFLLGQVPGFNRPDSDKVHYLWARRDFVAPTDAAFRNAVLHLHGVRWGSRIWLNGQEIGGHLGAYGAFEFNITDRLAWGKPNRLLLRMTGWPQVPMSKSADPTHEGPTPLVPHGAAVFKWGNRQPGIMTAIWIDYFDYARLERVQLIGDPKAGKVRIRGGMRNYTRQFGRRWIEATVLRDGQQVAAAPKLDVPWPNTSFGRVIYNFDFEVAVKDAAAWSPERPALYQVRLDLVQDGRRLARWTEQFGFRTFQARPEGFFLNDRRFFLRGICTVGQSFLAAAPADLPGLVRRYLVDSQRAANLNCVRNHTQPLDGVWLDETDRAGYLVLQEFPITMNYRHPALTADEEQRYHQQCLDEFNSLLPLYWNHPSVVVWVPTNESGFDTAWENGPLYQLFKQADPTRPVMRTSEETPDILDAHCYDGFWNGPEGKFDLAAAAVVPRARAARKPLTNTEYIEGFGGGRVTKWMGNKPADLSPEQWERQRQDVYAQIILEQTEVLRRLGYDGTLPYMWGGAYVGGMQDLARPLTYTPAFHALRSGQAPVLASLDLADRHFLAGQRLDVKVVLCDDTGGGKHDVLLALVEGDPGFVWPPGGTGILPVEIMGETPRPRIDIKWRKSIKLSVRKGEFLADGKAELTLPEKPGRYFLLAVTTGAGKDRPAAVSRRIIDVVARPSPKPLAGRTVAVFAADETLARDLARLAPEAKVVDAAKADLAAADAILIGPMIHPRLADLAAIADGVLKAARAGKPVVVLHQDRPLAPLGLVVPREEGYGGSSTAFREGPADFVGWRGLGDDSRLLRRFNGPTGAVVRLPAATQPDDEIEARAAQDSTDLIWPVMVSRPLGQGRLILCQMTLADHLAGPRADPVAQTILLNLLAGR